MGDSTFFHNVANHFHVGLPTEALEPEEELFSSDFDSLEVPMSNFNEEKCIFYF